MRRPSPRLRRRRPRRLHPRRPPNRTRAAAARLPCRVFHMVLIAHSDAMDESEDEPKAAENGDDEEEATPKGGTKRKPDGDAEANGDADGDDSLASLKSNKKAKAANGEAVPAQGGGKEIFVSGL